MSRRVSALNSAKDSAQSPPLKEEGPALRDFGQSALELARLAGEDERREGAELGLGGGQGGGILIFRQVAGGALAPV